MFVETGCWSKQIFSLIQEGLLWSGQNFTNASLLLGMFLKIQHQLFGTSRKKGDNKRGMRAVSEFGMTSFMGQKNSWDQQHPLSFFSEEHPLVKKVHNIQAIIPSGIDDLWCNGQIREVAFQGILIMSLCFQSIKCLPVSFSTIGLNSSGLMYKSLLVSREEKRKRPSFPRDFRAIS